MAASNALPRWRGFNLLGGFTMKSKGDFPEEHFRWISDWGFDFVRLPLCYTLWTVDDDPFKIDGKWLEKLDVAVEHGRKHGVHVCLSFHRGPGYSVNPERKEPFNLWTDKEALDAFCYHWETFAARYKGISNDDVSFNLINEPAAFGDNGLTRERHELVVRRAVAAIRAVDPNRLIIADGLAWGTEPCPELADLGIGQSCRAYAPMEVSHYKASWVNRDEWPEPEWPMAAGDSGVWDKERLRKFYDPWRRLIESGVGVHCGEGGAFNATPHELTLRWLRDVLEVLTELGIGLALWNLVGGFGVLDSGRGDVDYEDWHGHKLDRALLTLLQEFN